MLVITMLNEVRRALGYPPEQQLPDEMVLMEIWGTTTLYRSKLRMTHEAWEIKRWDLPVTAGTPTEADIDTDGFTEAFMVKTYDPANPYHIPRQVDLVRPEAMSSYWSGPDQLPIGGGWAHPHVAACFAPVREDGQWKMLWTPAHNQGCLYRVWYTVGPATAPPIIDDTSLMPIEEQNFFLVADVALNLFGYVADPAKGLGERQKLLMATQKKKYDQWAPLFEEARWNGFRRETHQRRKVFGEPREGRVGRGWPGGY